MYSPFCVSLLREIFYLDKRSLALFRVLLAIANIVCAWAHLEYGASLLSESGIQPVSLLNKTGTKWSLFYLFTSDLWNYFLVSLILLFSLLFALGYQTSVFGIALLILTISLENRYPISGGTVGLRLGLLWSIFLPLGEIKNPFKHETSKDLKIQTCSLVSITFILKICIFYWAAFFNKDYVDWAINNTALYYSLWWGGVATLIGEWIREYPDLTIWLTRLTLFLEFAAPIMLLLPFKAGLFRALAAIMLMCMHLGIQLSMNLEEFPYANFAIAAAFLPSSFWDFVFSFKFRQTKVYSSEWKFSFLHLIQFFLLLCVLWKNLYNFKLAPPMPKMVKTTLSALNLNERWTMFSGGGEYLTFWPIVKAKTKSGVNFDLWKWYLGLKDQKIVEGMPEHVGLLTPGIRWEKFTTNILLYRGLYGQYQVPFMNFLCNKFNQSEFNSNDPVVSVTLAWGWRVVLGIEKFGAPMSGDLRTIECADNQKNSS